MRPRILFPALCLLYTLSALAQTSTPTGDSLWYYEIGGARAISQAANPTVTSMTLGGSLELGMGYSCGNFDMSFSIIQTLENKVKAMMSQVQAAAQASIAALPMLILQRANPGLYDLLQSAMLRAEETFNLVTKDCEQMEAEIAQGKNPFQEWIILSKGNDWKRAMGTGGKDIVATKANIEANAGANGVPWVGGTRGGLNQEPIRIIEDTVKAGFNVTMDRLPHAGGTVNSAPVPLTKLWNDPQLAADWAVEVFGDKHIRTCNANQPGCAPPAGVAGVGLLPEHEASTRKLDTDLLALVEGTQPLTLSNLEAVSTADIGITRQLIEAIRELSPVEQSLTRGRLAGEIAQAQVLEKALYIRRLLLAGRQTPEIVAAEPAQKEIDRKLLEVDREIDNLLFETRVRKEVVSHTATVLLRQEAVRRGESLVAPSVTPIINPKPFEGGGVVP